VGTGFALDVAIYANRMKGMQV